MTSTATPDDVSLESGGVIATSLTDAQIQSYIDDAAYDAGQAINDYDTWDTEDKRQLEKYTAALYIRLYADQAIASASRETASVNYEGNDAISTSALRTAVDRRDPSGTLAQNTDTDRYVGSTFRES